MPTVLVVDDTAVDRKLAGRLLEKSANIRVIYADGGTNALELLETECPDLVVTDLQMPDMDGLQLLTAIEENYSEIPVVLMTAHGSEDIASLALEHGAASFVPKAELAELLADTVSQILALTHADHQYHRLITCSQRAEFEFELENDVELIEPLVELLQQIATSMRVVEGTRKVRLGVALEHAVHNAMFRGNLEIPRGATGAPDADLLRTRLLDPRYCERKVHVMARITRHEATFVISDQGPGFDTVRVPQPGTPESLNQGGRGLVLMGTFFSEMRFNAAGNQVTLIQAKQQPM
jgi:CheY-like chemotaxis protein